MGGEDGFEISGQRWDTEGVSHFEQLTVRDDTMCRQQSSIRDVQVNMIDAKKRTPTFPTNVLIMSRGRTSFNLLGILLYNFSPCGKFTGLSLRQIYLKHTIERALNM